MRYVALLRGINVSGQKLIKMADLKTLLVVAGLEEVVTYIQSGNIAFTGQADRHEQYANTISEAIRKHYNFDVPTVIRTQDEIKNMLTQSPFDETIHAEKGKPQLYYAILASEPTEAAIKALLAVNDDTDEYQIGNGVVYIRCYKGFGQTKFSNNFLEKILKVSSTTRNTATLQKMQDL